jgi:hypothetical protein
MASCVFPAAVGPASRMIGGGDCQEDMHQLSTNPKGALINSPSFKFQVTSFQFQVRWNSRAISSWVSFNQSGRPWGQVAAICV